MEDGFYYELWSSFKYDGEVAKFYKNHEEEAWYDLREDEKGILYIAVGDNDGLKFIGYIDHITVEYDGYEINIYGGWDKDNYIFGFCIDPNGGILRASDDERSFDFYDDLESVEEYYPKKDFSLKAAFDDLIAHSDDYQNSEKEEENMEE